MTGRQVSSHSRIVPFLPGGGEVVSTPRHHTGVVVTEYGAAELTGLTVRERAKALADMSRIRISVPGCTRVAETLGRQ